MDPTNPAAGDSQKTETIVAVMRRACPLEADLMGADALERIAAGKASYKSLPGGAHFDYTGTVAVLSGVATIVDVGFKLWSSVSSTSSIVPTEFAERLRVAINEQAVGSPDFSMILKKDPQLVERVIQGCKEVLASRPR